MGNELIRVLLIEDSEQDAVLILRELERGGYSVTSRRVDTPAGLKDALGEMPWDLVIADHTLPKFKGQMPLSAVREAGLRAPFIFVSGTLTDEAARNAMKAGAQDFVPKGDLQRLLPAVKRQLLEAPAQDSGENVNADVERQVRERTASLSREKESLEEENRRLRRELLLQDPKASPPAVLAKKPKILLVDDLPENLLALETILQVLDADLVKAPSGEVALRHLLDQEFALILLDVRMPELSGVDTAIFIRKRERSRLTRRWSCLIPMVGVT